MPQSDSDRPPAFTEPLLRPAEVARALAVEEHTLAVWRCAEAGPRHLPFIKIGGTVRYRKSDLDALVENGLQCA
jgi:hypothetical protein